MSVREVRESDLSGAPDAATVAFGVDDHWYEIDLTETERRHLETLLGKYIDKGRPTEAPLPRPRVKWPETTPEEREEIRTWALGTKRWPKLRPYGRIPKEVTAAYREAHPRD
ncbi:Lsr2 dimerization domain-containing protein [Granulicoccus phenolivorans]|uniref:Lsr2 dimerization domain-containing protein n=1 Tax=Granulicoccus phenolivorans TaxID=266854 RepID=UPI000684295B|nr:histone-like nucleoid-structuring protein Lsr2 [Granulicoccus phenolivorans]